MDIKKLVSNLKKKHGTSNPYVIAKNEGIIILYEDLGSIKGFYNMPCRQKQIHINQNISKQAQLITLSHELGHAFMHTKLNTPCLLKSTFLSVNKLEIEANKFAMELLISDEMLEEHKYFTISQLSKLFGYDEELISLRINK